MLFDILFFVCAVLVIVLFGLLSCLADLSCDLDITQQRLDILCSIPSPPADDAPLDEITAWNRLAEKKMEECYQHCQEYPDKHHTTLLGALLKINPDVDYE